MSYYCCRKTRKDWGLYRVFRHLYFLMSGCKALCCGVFRFFDFFYGGLPVVTLNIKLQGFGELKGLASAVRKFPEQARFAGVVAVSRTAVICRDEWRKEMRQNLDRPKESVLRQIKVWPATLDKPEAIVGFDRREMGGNNTRNMGEILGHLFNGGGRIQKVVEMRLQRLGILPSGMYVAPGKGAPLDSYGNISNGEIARILTRFGSFDISPMSARARKQLGKKGLLVGRGFGDKRRVLSNEYFVARNSAKQPIGIWKVKGPGRVVPVLAFIRKPHYRQFIDLMALGRRVVDAHLPRQLELALKDAVKNSGFKGRWG